MRYVRWLDHLPPWASWGALAVSEIFSGWELLFMALPLLVAAGVEAARLQLTRWRRFIEIACLLGVVACRLVNVGWVMIIIYLLFMLCGARLSQPREQDGHRRQIVFMAFLLFLLTTVANASISFLPVTLIWTMVAGLALLRLNWEKAASISKTTIGLPPLRNILVWTSMAALISSALFLALPRPIVRWRPMRFGANGFVGAMAGLSDNLSLEDAGAIQGNSEVVARILSPPGTSPGERKSMEARMALLVGFRMESAREGRWERARYSPRRWDIDFGDSLLENADTFEYFVYPSPSGLIPMPMGRILVFPPASMRIDLAGNGMTRWAYPLARPMPLRFKLGEPEAETIADWQIQRRELRTPDPITAEALNWSLRVAPGDIHPVNLVNLLTKDLQTFQYTLDNPSGGAADPLGDFLTRTRAGHCEFFAHALASALRHRGVASRVVNGYRLGPWIQEGGYWLITQNEAHSWVEYVNPDTNAWVTADPTPPAAASYYNKRWLLSEKFVNVMDAMRFRWDRYIVRFSDIEQQRGLAWIQIQSAKLWTLKPGGKTMYAILAGSAALFGLFMAWKRRSDIRRLFKADIPQGTVTALAPLIRSTRVQPLPGETLRAWITRLCSLRPDRQARLSGLADLIERNVYGNEDADIILPVKREAREWQKPPGL